MVRRRKSRSPDSQSTLRTPVKHKFCQIFVLKVLLNQRFAYHTIYNSARIRAGKIFLLLDAPRLMLIVAHPCQISNHGGYVLHAWLSIRPRVCIGEQLKLRQRALDRRADIGLG
jgi:hypothetical protein